MMKAYFALLALMLACAVLAASCSSGSEFSGTGAAPARQGNAPKSDEMPSDVEDPQEQTVEKAKASSLPAGAASEPVPQGTRLESAVTVDISSNSEDVDLAAAFKILSGEAAESAIVEVADANSETVVTAPESAVTPATETSETPTDDAIADAEDDAADFDDDKDELGLTDQNELPPTAAELATCAERFGIQDVEEIITVGRVRGRISAKGAVLAFKVSGEKNRGRYRIEAIGKNQIRGVCVFVDGERNRLRLRFESPVEKVYVGASGARTKVKLKFKGGAGAGAIEYALEQGDHSKFVVRGAKHASFACPKGDASRVNGWRLRCD